MKLHDLRPAEGSHKTSKRLGRGHGYGRGKTAGRGTKGQKSRSGGNLPAWFEGGQTPLHVRTPKLHGFKNRFRVAYAPLNVGRLAGAATGTLITPDVLEHDGLIRDLKLPVKILGGGDAPSGVTIHAHAFSRTAVEKIEAAGGVAQRLSWPDNGPIEDAADEQDAEESHDETAADDAGSDETAADGTAPEATDDDAPEADASADAGSDEADPEA